MREDRTIRLTIECDGGSLSVSHPEEGDIVDVSDIDALDLSLTVRDGTYNEVHISTVPKRKGVSDEGSFYIEGDNNMIKQLSDVLTIAARNIDDIKSDGD